MPELREQISFLAPFPKPTRTNSFLPLPDQKQLPAFPNHQQLPPFPNLRKLNKPHNNLCPFPLLPLEMSYTEKSFLAVLLVKTTLSVPFPTLDPIYRGPVSTEVLARA